jgi:AcrR family transcriptional regulator
MAKAGRRPGTPETRGRILEAARTAFGERGFNATTIRALAADARVDPALVHHYFSTKADLYAAAIELPMSPSTVIPQVFSGDVSGLGRRVTEFFFSVWEAPESRRPLLAMLGGAFGGNERGTAGFREFLVRGLLTRVVAAIGGGRRAEVRVELAMAHLLGIAVLRYVVRVEPLASVEVSRIVDLVAPRVQSYFDGEDHPANRGDAPRS